MNKKCVFIGGRQIGVNCLRVLLSHQVKPELVIGEIKDDGKDTILFESLINVAEQNNLNVLRGAKIKDEEIIEKIESLQPDIIFHVGGTQLIPIRVIRAAVLGCTNLHPALLPKYRGRFSTAHALFNGEEKTGVTLHWLSEGIDNGPIIKQKSYPITESDTGKTLYEKFTHVGTELFNEFVKLWLSRAKIPSTPQDESQATYYPKELPNNGEIDWSWDGEKIKRFIRAMTYEPYPPPTFKIGDEKMVIVSGVSQNSNQPNII